jgi:hypothetical protein
VKASIHADASTQLVGGMGSSCSVSRNTSRFALLHAAGGVHNILKALCDTAVTL